jgi:hypothetical protein
VPYSRSVRRWQGDFVDTVLAAGKSPFFLLPFLRTRPVAEVAIRLALENFSNQTARMADPRVRVVLARYDMPHLPIAGSSDSLAAALAVAKKMQRAVAGNASGPT